mmetsp:Transcript_50574/g.118105  ORF Transcript_50574/g.118105 Transcript_50574/m.118105 type:complete len:115 (+) Transcript_50574:118-462(+)
MEASSLLIAKHSQTSPVVCRPRQLINRFQFQQHAIDVEPRSGGVSASQQVCELGVSAMPSNGPRRSTQPFAATSRGEEKCPPADIVKKQKDLREALHAQSRARELLNVVQDGRQ